MQVAVKALALECGIDLQLMPSCIVNQAALAIDARNPVKLVESIERLIGTWPLRAQLADLQQSIQDTSKASEQQVERLQELAALRLRLRPEVDKLLQCTTDRQQLQASRADKLAELQTMLHECAAGLQEQVRVPDACCLCPLLAYGEHIVQSSERTCGSCCRSPVTRLACRLSLPTLPSSLCKQL